MNSINPRTSILYVEDDPGSLDIAQVLFQEVMGLTRIATFTDSTDFLNRVRALPFTPQLILLDIHVRPHNGFEMLAMLRETTPFNVVPIIALTASVMSDEVVYLRKAGFDGIIPKPIDMEVFPMQLERILNGEKLWGVLD